MGVKLSSDWLGRKEGIFTDLICSFLCKKKSSTSTVYRKTIKRVSFSNTTSSENNKSQMVFKVRSFEKLQTRDGKSRLIWYINAVMRALNCKANFTSRDFLEKQSCKGCGRIWSQAELLGPHLVGPISSCENNFR